MDAENQKDPKIPSKSPQSWYVNMPAGLCYEMNTLDEDQIDQLSRSLGPSAAKDDLVFYGSNLAFNSKKSRISALYRVTGEQSFHPKYEKVSTVQLLKRFQEPLIVDLNFDIMKKPKQYKRTKDENIGIYILGELNFDLVREAIADLAFSSDLDHHLKMSS